MKKFLLLLLLCSFILTAIADSRKDVIVTEIDKTASSPRSLIGKPVVRIDAQAQELSIRVASTESFILRVFDASGAEACQFDVIADGSEHLYFLPTLEEGRYSISIESANRAFEGEFNI